jgi:uncharacterized RDD family membrane protein YckC
MQVSSSPIYASRGARLGGHLIDTFVMLLPLGTGITLMALSETLGMVAFLAAAAFALMYYLFADARPRGQSFGKQALNIAVVHAETGSPCTALQSLMRNIVLYVLGPIDWIFIFGSRRQRLGDMLAGTIVVQTPDRSGR